ncbi:MAG: hypothetical protein H0U66_16480 [Gemmatimonadaceae bacterium]|nr:hypothetical protein [Gemmatimonadaceae bacterium]
MTAIQSFLFTSCAFAALFVMLVSVHELGHAAVALLYGRRLYSIRILGAELRFRKRRGKRGKYATSLHILPYVAGDHGDVRAESSPSRREDIVFSLAGIVCEAALIGTLWNRVVWSTADQNQAWYRALIISVVVAAVIALESVHRGGDLYFVLRAFRPKRRPRRRA